MVRQLGPWKEHLYGGNIQGMCWWAAVRGNNGDVEGVRLHWGCHQTPPSGKPHLHCGLVYMYLGQLILFMIRKKPPHFSTLQHLYCIACTFKELFIIHFMPVFSWLLLARYAILMCRNFLLSIFFLPMKVNWASSATPAGHWNLLSVYTCRQVASVFMGIKEGSRKRMDKNNFKIWIHFRSIIFFFCAEITLLSSLALRNLLH